MRCAVWSWRWSLYLDHQVTPGGGSMQCGEHSPVECRSAAAVVDHHHAQKKRPQRRGKPRPSPECRGGPAHSKHRQWRPYLGGDSPGDDTHSLIWDAVSS